VSTLDTDLEKTYDDLYANCQPLDLTTVQKLLRSTAQSFNTCFIILDALDESGSAQKDILETMNDLCGPESRLKGFVTSRHHPKEIQNVFDPASTIEIAADDSDVRNFIEESLMNEEVPVPPDLKLTIIKKLLANAQGS
jgi:hypothetical protein